MDEQMHADKQTQMHVHTHAHTHAKNVTIWSCAFCSRRLFAICCVDADRIVVSPPCTRIRLYQSVSLSVTWLTWHLTLLSRQRRWHLHLDGRHRSGGKSVDICDKLTPSLTLTLCTQTVFFSLPLFLKFLILSFFFILAQSVCLAHCQAACLFMCTFVLSRHCICVVFVSNSASYVTVARQSDGHRLKKGNLTPEKSKKQQGVRLSMQMAVVYHAAQIHFR